MKYPYPIFLSLFALFLVYYPVAHAEAVAIVLDDSVSMCGYLVKNKTTAYKQLLKSLQVAIEDNSDPVSLSLLDQVSRQSKLDRSKAMVELDRVIAGIDSNPPQGKKASPALPNDDNPHCAFHATTSPLGNIFTPSLNNADLVLLVTDFIFDGGSTQGGSASELEFTDNFANWAQGRSATSPNKKTAKSRRYQSKLKASNPLIEVDKSFPSPTFQAWSGIIGIRSAFEGKYFLRETGGASVPLKLENRPVYLFWRAKTPELAEHWLKPIMAALVQNDIHSVAFQILPSSAVIDPRHPVFAIRPKAFGAMADSLKPRVYYVNSRYEEYEKSRQKNPKRPTMENPIPASANPANCFKAQGLHIDFDSRCGNGGSLGSHFWEVQEINEIHIEYPLENEMSGLERSFTTAPTGFRENVYRVDYKTGKDGTKAVHIALAKIGNKLFESRGNPAANQCSLDLQEQLQVRHDLFDPAEVLKEWSSEDEPCESGSECTSYQDKTVGLVHFVKSLLKRSSQIQDQLSAQPGAQPMPVRIEFSVKQLP